MRTELRKPTTVRAPWLPLAGDDLERTFLEVTEHAN
jgi:hypothetical protein